MVINIEKIFNFLFYFLKNNFNITFIEINKNFFLKKKNFFFYFLNISKFFLKNIFFFNYYKKIFFKIFLYKKKKNIFFNFKNDFKFFDWFLLYDNIFLNPIKILSNKLINIFLKWKFFFFNASEIESFYNNFQFLNISSIHPSCSFKDSFYINFDFYNKILLRTHTTNIQSYLKNYNNIPLKIISIGSVYRNDSDNTHLPVFNQFELIFISKNINFFFFKRFFINLMNLLFKNKFKYRIRSSYFPFTIISYEIDIMYIYKNKKVWLEVCGMGMIQPNILNKLNFNYNLFRGFALGIGLERLYMIFFNSKDLKKLFISS